MTISVSFRQELSRLKFAVQKLCEAIEDSGQQVSLLQLGEVGAKADMVIVSSDDDATALFGIKPDASLRTEGFELRRSFDHGQSSLFVLALDESGAMYGTLELAERLRMYGELDRVPDCVVNPRFPFRAVKFNLPWSSYRRNECFDLQEETVRDLGFWERFLDMMAQNRYNVLTLWSMHPYPYMFRPRNFPKATPFSDDELAEWKQYWTSLFRMAKERGIETYLVNWNIFVSESFKKHYDPDAIDDLQYHHGDYYTSESVKRYNRESVVQLIEEYPDLTGIGFSVGERMNGMTPEARQDWINEVYFEAINQVDRPVKIIHRAPFSVDPAITRNAIESREHSSEPVWIEIKFNWSHAYSSSKLLMTHGGSSGMEGYWDPPPQNYKITWMIRNEDFFTLRWAQPDFIREHIAENGDEYVGGYYIGSECLIPGIDYSHVPESPHMDWTYAFEKHWLYYMLWGRLLYDPSTSDEVFTNALERRYGRQTGVKLLKAYSYVCEMPMELASFYGFTWDFTLYAEGFLATDKSEYNEGKAFISLQDLMESKPIHPDYLSIKAYVDRQLAGQTMERFVTPDKLADKLVTKAREALTLLDSISGDAPALECEKADVEAWAYLSLYFATKLRAGVCYETYRRTGDEKHREKASEWLQSPHGAAEHWENLIAVTQSHYVEQPLMHLGKTPFSWELFRPQLKEDIDFVNGETLDPSIHH